MEKVSDELASLLEVTRGEKEVLESRIKEVGASLASSKSVIDKKDEKLDCLQKVIGQLEAQLNAEIVEKSRLEFELAEAVDLRSSLEAKLEVLAEENEALLALKNEAVAQCSKLEANLVVVLVEKAEALAERSSLEDRVELMTAQGPML
jgi:chromosome segregation ATPase